MFPPAFCNRWLFFYGLLYHCSPSIALHHDEDGDDHDDEDDDDHDNEDGVDNGEHAEDGDDDDIFLLQAPLSLFAPHCFAYHYKYLIGNNFQLAGVLIDLKKKIPVAMRTFFCKLLFCGTFFSFVFRLFWGDLPSIHHCLLTSHTIKHPGHKVIFCSLATPTWE